MPLLCVPVFVPGFADLRDDVDGGRRAGLRASVVRA